MAKRQKLIEFRGCRTQSEMATKYGVSQQAWCKWENGEAAPDAPIMLQIEKDSGIPMEDLFCDRFNGGTAKKDPTIQIEVHPINRGIFVDRNIEANIDKKINLDDMIYAFGVVLGAKMRGRLAKEREKAYHDFIQTAEAFSFGRDELNITISMHAEWGR